MLDNAMVVCPVPLWDDGSGQYAFWYLAHGRRRLHEAITDLTTETAGQRCRFGWGEAGYLELLLYNLRHVQHHVGQLNLIIRRETGSAPRWVAQGQRGTARFD